MEIELLSKRMELTLVSHDDFLLGSATGQASLSEVLCVFKKVIDTAAERGFEEILLDFSAVKGELSVVNLYEVGSTIAEYCMSKALYPKVALIGKPPLVNGFGAVVASNRGLTSMTFPEREPALNWLRGFASKAPAS
jgi:hypothetical protein